MLPRRRCFPRNTQSTASLFLARRVRSCQKRVLEPSQPCKGATHSEVLAIAHATMTLLLVAPLRLSSKKKRKELASRQCVKFVSELRSTTFFMARAFAASLQVMRGTKKIRCVCKTQKTSSVQLLPVLLPIVFILILFICLLILESLLILFLLAKAFLLLRRRLTRCGRLVLRQ